MILSRRTLTSSLVALLAAQTGRPCGDGAAPPSPAGQERPLPYLVVYALPGGMFSGPPLAAPEADARVVYQVNAVASRRDQAEWLQDLVRTVLLDRGVTGALLIDLDAPAGWSIMDRSSDGGPGGVESSGRPPHRLFTAIERYAVDLTPA